MIIPLAHWSDSLESEWWLEKLYHPSISLITIDMSEESVLLVGKFIFRVKN